MFGFIKKMFRSKEELPDSIEAAAEAFRIKRLIESDFPKSKVIRDDDKEKRTIHILYIGSDGIEHYRKSIKFKHHIIQMDPLVNQNYSNSLFGHKDISSALDFFKTEYENAFSNYTVRKRVKAASRSKACLDGKISEDSRDWLFRLEVLDEHGEVIFSSADYFGSDRIKE